MNSNKLYVLKIQTKLIKNEFFSEVYRKSKYHRVKVCHFI